MPCMSCGSSDHDYCRGCFDEATGLLAGLVQLYQRTDQDAGGDLSGADYVDECGVLVERVKQFLSRIPTAASLGDD